MGKHLAQSIREFREHWRNYFIQSLMAALVMFGILFVLSLKDVVVMASIGSTAFIVFTMPASITAKSRNVIGGHFVGALFGSLCALIPHSESLSAIAVYSFAVGLAIFSMVVLDVEHPPAAGTALGISMTGISWSLGIALFISVCMLSSAHRLFRKNLRDLT
jgi:CBS-domain-containing membrane protein